MAIRIRGFRGIALGLAVLAALGIGSTTAQALVITVDPGVVGGPSNSPIVAGQVVTVGDPVLEVRFADMKHVEALAWGFTIVDILAAPCAGSCDTTTTIPFTMNLTDEAGAPVGFVFTDSFALGLLGGAEVRVVVPVTAHDFHVEFSTPVDFVIDVFVDGRVGVWGIPEPSTLTLFGAGLLGLALLARRRRKAA